jgi:signal peptidase II
VDALRDLRVGALGLPAQVGLLVAALGIVLDQATKELAEALLSPSHYVPWLGRHVGWQLVYNPGGAFGMPAPSWVFLIVTLLVVGIVARTLPVTRSLTQGVAYGLLLAGALGNAVDRLFRPGDEGLLGGYVVDFVAWGAWPRFNVADSAISVGFVLLLVALWVEERRDRGPGTSDALADEPSGDAADDGPAALDRASRQPS